MKTIFLTGCAFLALLSSCSHKTTEKTTPADSIGSIQILDSEANQLFAEKTSIDILASGFMWSEGPLWLKDQKMLIFSDVPTNKIYSWTEKDSLKLYLTPSGYTDTVPHLGEMGSNGLCLSPSGKLVLAQHGDRRIAEMQAPLNAPKADFKTLAGAYQGKRFNSPNDVTFDTRGNMYFTDPPYGLEKGEEDIKKELVFHGVFKAGTDTSAILLIDTLTRPNGILVSADGHKLFVANSDPHRAIWAMYDLDSTGAVSNGKILMDATSKVGSEKGLPDGMCTNSKGYIFATGPGGVWVFNPAGKHIATIHVNEATSNVELDDTQTTLFITADMYLLRVKLK